MPTPTIDDLEQERWALQAQARKIMDAAFPAELQVRIDSITREIIKMRGKPPSGPAYPTLSPEVA